MNFCFAIGLEFLACIYFLLTFILKVAHQSLLLQGTLRDIGFTNICC